MNAERRLMVLRHPHTSEKATIMAEKFKQFTFNVLKDAKKSEIKDAVETLFNVKVQHVSVLIVKGKAKKFKQLAGKQNDWKKAYVVLAPGHDIDFTIAE